MARREKESLVHGLALVDKEVGWTSHDVVAKSRGILGTRKVGHAGTLDPPATGLLLVGAGRMTRLLRFLTALPKTYVGEIVLGTETSTLDDTGDTVATHDMAGVSLAEVRAAAQTLTGDIMQVPPMVSAVKIDGVRLHEHARAGVEVERPSRPVTVHAFAVGDPVEPGVFPVEVTCSSGTYIRTLAADVGTILGGGAHLRRLRRTAAGSFHVDDASTVEHLDPERLLSPAEALRDLTAVAVSGEVEVAVGHGRPLPRDVLGLRGSSVGPWAVVDRDGVLLAVYEPYRDDLVKPAVVVH